jgi:hypothetical protein
MILALSILAAPLPNGGTITWDEVAIFGGAMLVAGLAMWFLLRGEDDDEQDGDGKSKPTG